MGTVFVKKVMAISTPGRLIIVVIGNSLPNIAFPTVIWQIHAPITHAVVTAIYVLNIMKVNVQHVII